MRFSQLGGAALSLMMVAPAFAQEDAVTGWSVASRYAPSGGVAVYCGLTMAGGAGQPSINVRNQPIEKGATSTTKQGPAVLRFTVPEKVLSEKRVDLAGVAISIEGQKSWTGLAATWTTRGEGGVVQAVLDSDIQAVLRPLARGSELAISLTPPGGQAKTYSVSLKGSGAATTAYQACLGQIR